MKTLICQTNIGFYFKDISNPASSCTTVAAWLSGTSSCSQNLLCVLFYMSV